MNSPCNRHPSVGSTGRGGADRIQPFHTNTGKRLIKSPKIYVRDSGLLHTLLGIADYNGLAGRAL